MVAWNLNQIFPSFFRIIIDKLRIFAMIRRKQNLVIYLFLLLFRRLAAMNADEKLWTPFDPRPRTDQCSRLSGSLPALEDTHPPDLPV